MYRAFVGFVVAVFLCLSVCGSATAWPDRTVRLILPVPAGSAADFTARLFAERLSVLWAQPVIVEALAVDVVNGGSADQLDRLRCRTKGG